MQPRGITYVMFVFACSLGGLTDISMEASYTIISIYVTLEISYVDYFVCLYNPGGHDFTRFS